MKMMIRVLVILVLVHVLAAAGFVGWLGVSGRLSQARLEKVHQMFRPTLAQQKQHDARAQQQAQQERRQQQEAARLEAVSDGPRTMSERLAHRRERDAVAKARLDRLHEETRDLRARIAQARTRLTRREDDLEAEREEFRRFMEEKAKQRKQEAFQQAVGMYEQLRPDQAKRMFQNLIQQGETGQVVDYLAAMQKRKAGKIIEAFQTPAEIKQATKLLERLRTRGIYPGASLVRENQPGEET